MTYLQMIANLADTTVTNVAIGFIILAVLILLITGRLQNVVEEVVDG